MRLIGVVSEGFKANIVRCNTVCVFAIKMEISINRMYKSITNLSRFNLEPIRKMLFLLYLIIVNVYKTDNINNWSKHLMLILSYECMYQFSL